MQPHSKALCGLSQARMKTHIDIGHGMPGAAGHCSNPNLNTSQLLMSPWKTLRNKDHHQTIADQISYSFIKPLRSVHWTASTVPGPATTGLLQESPRVGSALTNRCFQQSEKHSKGSKSTVIDVNRNSSYGDLRAI